MKIILISTVVTILLFFFTYFITAFIFAEIDFRLWNVGIRFLMILTFCILEVLTILGISTTLKDKNNG